MTTNICPIAAPPPPNLVFSGTDGKPILILDANGVDYKGQRIEDAGDAYQALMRTLCVMPRSSYIYLVRRRADHTILGAFTVKYEAETWIKQSGLPPVELALSRLPDGRPGPEVDLPFCKEY
ncbi:MAG: hypothetical protein ACYDH4_10815 [Candidatus Cryosericum sp.]